MIDEKEVLKALVCRASEVARLCDGCPYERENDWGCDVQRLCKDVLTLLKAQEVRVLSFNELKFDAVYWMERIDIRPWPVAFRRMRGNPEFLVFEDYYGDMWDVSKYCVREGGWRCWISRPTDEQRKAVPWNE